MREQIEFIISHERIDERTLREQIEFITSRERIDARTLRKQIDGKTFKRQSLLKLLEGLRVSELMERL